MKIASSWSTTPDVERAVTDAYDALVKKLGSSPDYVMVFTSVAYDSNALMKKLKELAPGAQLHGGTSCVGIITEEGAYCSGGKALGLWGICDKEGSYGVGAAPRGDNPFSSAADAVTKALRESGRPGEIPELVIMIAAPGYEEMQIKGIQDVVGPDVPIIGGSSADNDFSKPNLQFADGQVYDDALSVAVMFPSAPVGYAFHSGYTPTEISGIVTRCEDRVLYEIDNRPAATVFHEWVDQAIQKFISAGGNIQEATDLYPFGKIVGSVGDVPYYRLVYSINPDIIKDDKSLTMLAEVNEGDKLYLMSGTRESLISRAGRVVQAAMENKSLSPSEVSGVFFTYCAGCMLALKGDMSKVVDEVNDTLKGKPFLGAFTYGEQGCFLGGENCHGNLMISTLVFGS